LHHNRTKEDRKRTKEHFSNAKMLAQIEVVELENFHATTQFFHLSVAKRLLSISFINSVKNEGEQFATNSSERRIVASYSA
jgi:hypothetical protein